jgi:hypothetical protein
MQMNAIATLSGSSVDYTIFVLSLLAWVAGLQENTTVHITGLAKETVISKRIERPSQYSRRATGHSGDFQYYVQNSQAEQY